MRRLCDSIDETNKMNFYRNVFNIIVLQIRISLLMTNDQFFDWEYDKLLACCYMFEMELRLLFV